MKHNKQILLFEVNTQSTNEKIKISPIGEFVGIDGRKYILDADSVMQNMRDIGCDIMLDKDHEDKGALGWFSLNSLELKEDGLYASLELNTLGKQLLEDRVYRYLSPGYICKESQGVKIVDRIASVGLVNRPNLLFESLNKEQEEMNENEEIEELKAKIEELKKENEALKEQLEKSIELNQSMQKIYLESRVNEALKRSEMLPSRKEIALSLNKEALDAYLDVCKQEAKHVLQNKTLDLNKQDVDIDANIKEQLGL